MQFLLGHEQIETTMRYLDITKADKIKALATLENENERKLDKKWKDKKGALVEYCSLKR